MGNVILALHEERVTVAVGRVGAKPSVKKLLSAPVMGSGIENVEAAVRSLWSENKLPRSGITMVVPGSAASIKLLTAPDMSAKRLDELVHHEMQTREGREMVADYITIGKDEQNKPELLCAACSRDELTQYIEMMERLKLKVKRITVPLIGHLLLLSAMAAMKKKTCIWLCFEGSSMLSVLVENGKYRYSSRSRIFSEPGTVDFGTEVTRSVSGTRQFQSTNRSGHVITEVYFAGCSDDDFEVCLPGLESMGLEAGRLPDADCFRRVPEGERMSDWLECAGAMLK